MKELRAIQGMGLALVAQSKGYKCIFTLADKQSQEKIDILRAVGAEVIVCPTNVEPSDPRSYYSVAKKLNEEIPNSFYPNQYDNPETGRPITKRRVQKYGWIPRVRLRSMLRVWVLEERSVGLQNI